MTILDIHRIPVLNDNWVYLAHEPETGSTAVVDPVPVFAEVHARKDRFQEQQDQNREIFR